VLYTLMLTVSVKHTYYVLHLRNGAGCFGCICKQAIIRLYSNWRGNLQCI